MFSGDASHANWGSRRLFFRPAVGCLPSARHCSHVCGFLKSNLPFLPGRNCVRGIFRSHNWHVNGLGWSLPSARHCSHVCGFLKSNWPFLPGRNCVRGMVRSHTWHVNGFAAASLDLCSFTALPSLPASARSSLERLFAPPSAPPSAPPRCPCSRPSCPYSPLISARQAWHLVHAPCGNNLKTKSSRVWTPNSFSNFQ